MISLFRFIHQGQGIVGVGNIAFSLPGFGQGVEVLIEENIRKLIREE